MNSQMKGYIGQGLGKSWAQELLFPWSLGAPLSQYINEFTNQEAPLSLVSGVFIWDFIMWAWLIKLLTIIKLNLQKTYTHFCFSFTKRELQRDSFVLSAKHLKSQIGRNKYRSFKNY